MLFIHDFAKREGLNYCGCLDKFTFYQTWQPELLDDRKTVFDKPCCKQDNQKFHLQCIVSYVLKNIDKVKRGEKVTLSRVKACTCGVEVKNRDETFYKEITRQLIKDGTLVAFRTDIRDIDLRNRI